LQLLLYIYVGARERGWSPLNQMILFVCPSKISKIFFVLLFFSKLTQYVNSNNAREKATHTHTHTHFSHVLLNNSLFLFVVVVVVVVVVKATIKERR
jgi:hypothetical protein